MPGDGLGRLVPPPRKQGSSRGESEWSKVAATNGLTFTAMDGGRTMPPVELSSAFARYHQASCPSGKLFVPWKCFAREKERGRDT